MEAPLEKGFGRDQSIREILGFAKCIALLTFDQMDRGGAAPSLARSHYIDIARAAGALLMYQYDIAYITLARGTKFARYSSPPLSIVSRANSLKESSARNYVTTVRECRAFLRNPPPSFLVSRNIP